MAKPAQKWPKSPGRWHHKRQTLITDLAESGGSDQTIMDIAGHVSKRMLKHYSHIRMETKRATLGSIVQREVEAASPAESEQDHSQPMLDLSVRGCLYRERCRFSEWVALIAVDRTLLCGA
jgi:hypothetical protein